MSIYLLDTTLASERNVSLKEARAWLGNKLAAVELLPYHSAHFRERDRWLDEERGLSSVALARAFMKERVGRGGALVIITRKADHWGLEDGPKVIKFSPEEARGAHLTPDSRGGKAILEHLRRMTD